MTSPDPTSGIGVDLLLRRATDDLRPDIDQLVAGGLTRGRSRQRRNRIGTAVAAVAVFGVIGAGAAAVPHLGGGGADSAPAPIATDPPAPEPTSVAPLAPASGLAVGVESVPDTVDALLGGNRSEPLIAASSGGDAVSRTAFFRYDGMLTSVTVEKGTGTIAQCAEVECADLPDGSTRLEWGPTTADGVTAQGVTWWRRGYEVSAVSYNAAEGKESPPLAPAPPLSLEQLRLIAGSDVWFS